MSNLKFPVVGNRGAWVLSPDSWDNLMDYSDAFYSVHGVEPDLELSDVPGFIIISDPRENNHGPNFQIMAISEMKSWTANLTRMGQKKNYKDLLSRLLPVNIFEVFAYELSSSARGQ